MSIAGFPFPVLPPLPTCCWPLPPPPAPQQAILPFAAFQSQCWMVTVLDTGSPPPDGRFKTRVRRSLTPPSSISRASLEPCTCLMNPAHQLPSQLQPNRLKPRCRRQQEPLHLQFRTIYICCCTCQSNNQGCHMIGCSRSRACQSQASNACS